MGRRGGSVQPRARFEAADALEDRDCLAGTAERLAPGLAVQEAPLPEAEVDLPDGGVGMAESRRESATPPMEVSRGAGDAARAGGCGRDVMALRMVFLFHIRSSGPNRFTGRPPNR